MQRTAIILSGGGAAPRHPLPPADLVVAADSGAALASELGLQVDLVVGDLDSADPALIAELADAGAEIDRHPTDKDATDLELAMEAVLARGATAIVVAGGGGGRLDHLLGVALLIGSDRWRGVRVEWHTAGAMVVAVHDEATFDTEPGDQISVLPLGPAPTVTIGGTRWQLDRVRLDRGTSRGISNVAIDDVVRVAVSDGPVLVVQAR